MEIDETITCDRLVGDWRIYQLQRGHRFSTDDMAVAWRASLGCPGAVRLLDIGSGIGSVGLMTLHHLRPEATLVGVEAQEISYTLAQRTRALNGLEDRVQFVHGDLRDPEVLPEHARFDLITGSPPYVPADKGVHSPHPQRAACRMELRGSIFAYCEAARRWMAPGGRFCYVMAAGDPRTEEAPLAHGLTVLERWNYVFGAGRAPHIATLLCARDEDGPHPPRQEGALVIRGEDGRWTDDYMRFRRDMSSFPSTAS